jgi:hypothetical protein
MTRLLRWSVGLGCLTCTLLVSTIVSAQQKAPSVSQRNFSYDVSRESVLRGTVIQYTPSSSVAPLGPHVTLATGSGVVDVHLGSTRLLEANHLSLSAGESIQVVGENVAYGTGTQFVARVIQKGNQTVALRTTRGFPLAPMGRLGPRTEGGAL